MHCSGIRPPGACSSYCSSLMAHGQCSCLSAASTHTPTSGRRGVISTCLQVASHAQKFYSRVAGTGGKHRRGLLDVRSACPADTSSEERARLKAELQRCNAASIPPAAELVPPGAPLPCLFKLATSSK